MSVCVHAHEFACVYACVHVCVHMCVCVCVCVCAHMRERDASLRTVLMSSCKKKINQTSLTSYIPLLFILFKRSPKPLHSDTCRN